MTLLPRGVKVHLAFGYIDMRKGIDGLAMLVQGVLRQDPFSTFRGPYPVTTLIYSLWTGYLDRDRSQLASWCQKRAILLKMAHTSGHADPSSLVRLAKALNPRVVIPIHTEAPRVMESLVGNVRILHDGDWLTV